jgi:hypothetical protein
MPRRHRPARLAALLLLAAALAWPGPARAWLAEGHQATGAIAYDALLRHDPEAARTAVALLMAHPDRARFDAELAALPAAARGRRLMALMATWPDLARGGPWDHDSWHYDQAFASPIRHLVPFSFGGAFAAFRRNLATLRDAGAPPQDRAVALAWVMHIVGDMHQPLHAAIWLSWRFPVSDAGGNWSWVRPEEDAAPMRLHWFWDSAGRPPAPRGSAPDAFVAELERLFPFEAEAPPADPVAAFAGWVAYTRVLAADAVYEHGRFPPGLSPDAAPVLRPDYVARAQAIGAAQIAAAGNRIGALLLGLR